MKDNEFSEKFPMLMALQQSIELLKKTKYDVAIENLENVLKADPSTDLTNRIRGNVWFNLSVLYVLKGHFEKAFNALNEHSKYQLIEQYRISIKESLTPSQRKIIDDESSGKYKFNNYSYFLNSKKFKKKFYPFLKALESLLNIIESSLKGEKDLIKIIKRCEELEYFRNIIIYANFNQVDLIKGRLSFENEDLYRLFINTSKLFELYDSIVKKTYKDEQLSKLNEIEALINQGNMSTAKEKLNNFLNTYSVLDEESVKRALNDSDGILKKAQDLLNICNLKEDEIKKKVPYDTSTKDDKNSISIENMSGDHPNDISVKLKNAGFWILTPFVIDDDGGGDYTWLEVSSEEWCSGSGTYNDPYVIKNLVINGQDSTSCITIRDSTKHFILNNNTLYNCGTGLYSAGLYLRNTLNGKIIGCNISYNNKHGIDLDGYCYNNTIQGNIFNNNSNYAIRVSSSDGNRFLNNIMTNNLVGINLGNSHDNTITGNYVSNSEQMGIHIKQSSSNNLVFNNSFIKNNPNGIDDSSNNNWDNSSLGNYWSDYGGVDANDDGIGDTPYSITGTAGSQDHYPIWNEGVEGGYTPKPPELEKLHEKYSGKNLKNFLAQDLLNICNLKEEQEKQKENKNEVDSKFKSPLIIKTRNKPPEVFYRTDLIKDPNLKEDRSGIVFKVNRDSIKDLALMKESENFKEEEIKKKVPHDISTKDDKNSISIENTSEDHPNDISVKDPESLSKWTFSAKKKEKMKTKEWQQIYGQRNRVKREPDGRILFENLDDATKKDLNKVNELKIEDWQPFTADAKTIKYLKKVDEKKEEEYNIFKEKINKNNLAYIIQQVEDLHDLVVFLEQREALVHELFLFFQKDNIRAIELIIQYFSSYFEINPYEMDFQFMPYILDSKERVSEIFKNIMETPVKIYGSGGQPKLRQRIWPTKLKDFYEKFEEFNYDSLKNQYLTKISKEVKEYIFDLPVKNLYNFLMDFSKVIPLKGSDRLSEDSKEDDYKIKSYLGLLCFKVIDSVVDKKITYYYDFSKSHVKEKGKLYLDFIDLTSGKVKLIIRNEIFESLGKIEYLNWIGINLKSWIDQNIGKIVAKVVQATFYEKSFDDLTMGNYRILQAKFNALGKDISELKTKVFEVKSPLTLNSFECSECGATLNITSKDEKFIICDHCSTPFLMEWQKN